MSAGVSAHMAYNTPWFWQYITYFLSSLCKSFLIYFVLYFFIGGKRCINSSLSPVYFFSICRRSPNISGVLRHLIVLVCMHSPLLGPPVLFLSLTLMLQLGGGYFTTQMHFLSCSSETAWNCDTGFCDFSWIYVGKKMLKKFSDISTSISNMAAGKWISN